MLFLTACGHIPFTGKLPLGAQNGVLDITDWNFARDGVVPVQGEVEFYWKHLLHSEDFSAQSFPQPRFINIPAPWNGYRIQGEPLPGDGYATYRLKILLPDQYTRTALAFKIPEFETAYILYVDGKILSINGTVGETADTMRPQWRPVVVDFIAESSQLEIILQISNFHHRKGGAGQLMLFGTEQQIREIRERQLAFGLFLFGSLLIIGLYHFSLFLFRRTSHSALYFGICCLLMAFRVLFSGELYFSHIFPGVNWQIIVKCNYLSFYLTVPLFGMFFQALFFQEISLRVLRIVQYIGGIFSVIVLLTPVRVFSHTMQTYQSFIIIGALYYLYLLVISALHKREGAIVCLIGLTCLLITVTNDILHSNAVIRTGYIAPFGILLFVIAQTILLSRRFSMAFFRVELLSAELEDRVAERTIELSLSNTRLLQTNTELQQEILRRQQVEHDLIQAKVAAEAANIAKSTFLANMTHELRTPLNAILGFTQILVRHPHTPDEKEQLAIIQRSGEHLLALINQVLDLSKIEAGQMTLDEGNVELDVLLHDLEDMFLLKTRRKGLRLHVECDDNVPHVVRTDEVKLRQVLMNLLGNAIKFTEKGTVRLKIEKCQLKIENPEDVASGRQSSIFNLQFSISDTGPGIAPEELNSLFENFSQTRVGRQAQEGTGLGLSISRKFVNLMGGDVSVTSSIGHGTTFSFKIQVGNVDMTEMQPPQPTRRTTALQPGQPQYRILIVDDNPDNRALLVKLLSNVSLPDSSFELRTAVNGQEAIEIWNEWEPDLILMDLRMPVMDGYEAARQIKSAPRGKQSTIVALSASILDEDRETALAAGCEAFLQKPFRDVEIFELLHTHLGVRFVYEEDHQATDGRHRKPEEELVMPEALTALPEELTNALQEALESIDLERTHRIINQIRHHNAQLAEALTELIHEYRFDILQQVFETTIQETSDHKHTPEIL